MSAEFSALFPSALIFSTMSRGVPVGARIPNHDDASKPGTPASAIVGTSGNAGARFVEVTAIARSLPALMCGIAEGRLSNMICTWPPSRSVIAGAEPLYGTCDICTPVITLNSSPDKWIDVPLPLEAKLIAPGLSFASLINSATVFAGTEGCATSTFGTPATRMTGAKSFAASYGIFAYRLGLIACVPTVPISSV
jgi:hypothetical protein